jgi:chorismate--pyruvate lyase
MFRKAGAARWFSHVNAVNPPHEMKHWLTDRISLTAKLIGRSSTFRVHCLHQGRRLCLVDEYGAVGLKRQGIVTEREVLLRCDERAVVFAHTIMPLSATASDWPFFNTLGNKSLGTTLFGDPKVVRGSLQYAKLHAGHPLSRRAMDALGEKECVFPLYARRCLFRRKRGQLLVTEVFFPGIQAIAASDALKASGGASHLATISKEYR